MSVSALETSRSNTSKHALDPASNWKRPLLRWRFYVVIGVVIVLMSLANKIAQQLAQAEFGYLVLLSKEGVIESLGAMFCLLASLAFLSACFPPQSRLGLTAPSVVRNRLLLVVLVLFSLLTFLEELGWGLRLIVWFMPSWGVDDEFRLTELLRPRTTLKSPIPDYWYMVMVFWGAILPVAARCNSTIGRGLERFGIPTPSLRLGLAWLLACVMALLLLIAPNAFSVTSSQAEEVTEAFFQLLLFAWAYEEYVRAWPADLPRRSIFWRIVLVAAALLSVGCIVYDVATRTGPSARSQRALNAALELTDPAARIEAMQRALNIWDNDFAHYMLANELDDQGRLAEAIPHYVKAARLADKLYTLKGKMPENPKQVSTYYWHLGQAYLNARNANFLYQAREALTRASQLDPQNDQIKQELAFVRWYEKAALSLSRRADWKQIQEEWKRQQAAGEEP